MSVLFLFVTGVTITLFLIRVTGHTGGEDGPSERGEAFAMTALAATTRNSLPSREPYS
jgi:hypothetical protein